MTDEHEKLVEIVAKLFTRTRAERQTGPFILSAENIDGLVLMHWRDDVPLARAAISAIYVAMKEPTSAMIRDGVSYRLSTSIGGDNRWPEDTAKLYSAMLAASPLNGGRDE
jgi:hypothetical protein